MVIGPPYDCRVTFDDRADLIVSYCIRRPTTLTGTFEARVFQTIPTSFFFFSFLLLLSFPFFLAALFFRRRQRQELENYVGNVCTHWCSRGGGTLGSNVENCLSLLSPRRLPKILIKLFRVIVELQIRT